MPRRWERVDFSVLEGLTLQSIVRPQPDYDDSGDRLVFTTSEGRGWTGKGRVFEMYHAQDCCERVYLADVVGNLDDLIGSPIRLASVSSKRSSEGGDSTTWTFYVLATVKGYVTLRWIGESNGYYSEAVDFEEVIEIEVTPDDELRPGYSRMVDYTRKTQAIADARRRIETEAAEAALGADEKVTHLDIVCQDCGSPNFRIRPEGK